MLIFRQSCQKYRRAVYITHSTLIIIFAEKKDGKRALGPFRKCQRECWINRHLNAKFKNPVTAVSQKYMVIGSREARNLEDYAGEDQHKIIMQAAIFCVCCSDGGVYEEYIILGCNAIQFEDIPTFRRNMASVFKIWGQAKQETIRSRQDRWACSAALKMEMMCSSEMSASL